jgi:hypothetical protein
MVKRQFGSIVRNGGGRQEVKDFSNIGGFSITYEQVGEMEFVRLKYEFWSVYIFMLTHLVEIVVGHSLAPQLQPFPSTALLALTRTVL